MGNPEKTEEAIKNGQSRDIMQSLCARRRTKTNKPKNNFTAKKTEKMSTTDAPKDRGVTECSRRVRVSGYFFSPYYSYSLV
jgi:hypothetical protein